MRDEALASPMSDGPDGAGAVATRCRAGRTCSRRGPGARVVLMLTLIIAAVAIGLPSPRWVPSTEPARTLPGPTRAPIQRLAFGPGGGVLATTDEAGGLAVWRAGDGWASRPVPGIVDSAKAIAFLPGGRRLAVGGEGPGIIVCDVDSGERVRSLGIPVRWAHDLKVSPDGRTLAVSGAFSPEIHLWDLEADRERMVLRGHSTTAIQLAFAPDGRSLASAARKIEEASVRIWDLADGRLSGRIAGMASPLQAMAFSPDGRRIAGACSHEKAVRVWDVATGREVLAIAGHSLSTRSLAFSPDGRLLATVSGDGTGGIWGASTGRELLRLDGRVDWLRNVAFSPDGRTLAATGNDGDVRFWDVDDRLGEEADR